MTFQKEASCVVVDSKQSICCILNHVDKNNSLPSSSVFSALWTLCSGKKHLSYSLIDCLYLCILLKSIKPKSILFFNIIL